MNAPTHDPAVEALREQAIVWFTRVRSPQATDQDWADLTLWLEASEANHSAFEEVESLSAEIEDARAEVLPLLSPQPIATGARPRWSAPGRRRWIFAAAASIAALALISPFASRAWYGSSVVYRTGPGETRVVTLADGSKIGLDAASTVTVQQGWGRRRVEMGDAEASFDVAKDTRRPFVVTAGDQQVRVVGTEFNMRHYDGVLVVSVRRGVVEVLQPAKGAEPVARLTRGRQLRHADGAGASVGAIVDPDAAFAWTQGRLSAHDEPLPEIVAYLNRRYPIPIRLSERAAGKRFSGALELGDEARTVQRLSAYLSLSVERHDREFVLH